MNRPPVLLTTAMLVLLPAVGAAKQPPEERKKLATVEPIERSVVRGAVRTSLETGAALHLGNLNLQLEAGSPENRGRQALRRLAGQLGLLSADADDLRLHAVREGLSGTTVRFRQHVEGAPVYGADIAITFNHDGVARTITSSYRPQVATLAARPWSPDTTPQKATAVARRHVGATTKATVGTDTEMVVLVRDGVARWAHKVLTKGPGYDGGGWEVMVGAEEGTVLAAYDTHHYATGSGRAFMPDPLSSAGVSYNDPGYTDGNDADTPELVGQIATVSLLDITENSGTFSLTGPWAEVTDHDAPSKGLFSQNSSTWDVTRTDDAFEAVNTYFHIDAYMRYLNITLGLDITPTQYVGGVRFDPSGWNGADQSSYSGGSGRLQFGEGGVDDGEDADVIIHELGHALHDWVTSGGLSQVNGLSEGIGDYAAVGYSRGFAGQWTSADPQYNWVFVWDGHNPFWGGRVTNYNDTNDYPDDLTDFSIHTDGQFWSSCNIDILEQIGAAKTDVSHWEGIARTNGSTNHDGAAQAVIDATVDLINAGGGALGHTAADLGVIASTYQDCGYTITVPDLGIFTDGFESGNLTSWTTSVGGGA